jgi:dynein heavy chain
LKKEPSNYSEFTSKVQAVVRGEEAALRKLLDLIVRVTLQLQTKLRTMFLPTANRCHYIFTLRDLRVIFRNLTLSLHPGCSPKSLLLLWEHECFWVYGHRMVNEVDFDRFHQAFLRAVRRDFRNEEHVSFLY